MSDIEAAAVPTSPAATPEITIQAGDGNAIPPVSVPLAQTKRKFHSLLESITRGPSVKVPTSTSTTSLSYDSPAKRIRLEARKRLESSAASTPSSTSTYIQSQLLASRLAAARKVSSGSGKAGNADSPAPPEANYLPWSHDAFLRRLKTFADLSIWTSKPDAVNEVAWAKRGWVCVGVNTVACKGGCERRLVVQLRRPRKDENGKDIEGSEDYSVDVDDELVKRYIDMIETGHDEECLWREGGCKDDIYRVQIARPAIWMPQLKERYWSFVDRAEALPDLKTLQLPFDTPDIVQQFPKDFFSRPVDASNLAEDTRAAGKPADKAVKPLAIDHTALAFSLLGWQASGPSESAIATCPTCFRRLGLWLYKAKLPPDATDGTHPSEPPTPPALDLLQNHRTYCPWTNATSQAMPGSFSGLCVYEILLRLIKNTFPQGFGIRPGTRDSMISDSAFNHEQDRPTTRMSMAASTIRTVSSVDSNLSIDSTAAHLGEDENRDRVDENAERIKKRARDKKQIDEQDKARFKRLRELGRAIGLGSIKRKKKAV